MKKQITYLVRYILFWMILFTIMRIFFVLFNGKLASAVPISELSQAFLYGLRLDLSAAGYLTAFPLIMLVLAHYMPAFWLSRITSTYNIIVLVGVCLISIIDAQLYEFWGQKLNAYASSFAKFPKEMASFSSGVAIGKLIFFGLLMYFLVSITYDNLVMKLRDGVGQKVNPFAEVGLFLVSAALLFLMIRGSVGMSPMNQSFAYYSDKPFCNHTAVNTTWNYLATLFDNTEDEKKNPYSFLPQHEADELVKEALTNEAPAQIAWSNYPRPDVLIIILEGWTADVVGAVGGETDVTPNLNAWANQSLVYTNFYANGNRTDKGLAAIISAQPSLAKSSIINKLQKFSNLPGLPKSLAAQGYHSKFVYGGEAEFANMKAYWVNSGYQNIVDIHQFNKAIMPESWGVQDDALYEKLLSEFGTTPSPKFVTALTLSSHEPYKVPHTSQFTGDDQSNLYRNSVHYADACLGQFLQQASTQPWYNNTLIVIMADHAHQEPLNRSQFEPARFHIPFIVTGGALQKSLHGLTISKLAQQTDFAGTLLHQLGLPSTDYKWGKNLLDTLPEHGLATYTYDDGIGYLTNEGFVVYDAQAKRVIAGNQTPEFTNKARAYQQSHYQEYLQR